MAQLNNRARNRRTAYEAPARIATPNAAGNAAKAVRASKKPANPHKSSDTRVAGESRVLSLFRTVMHTITTIVMVVAIVLAAALVGVRLIGYDVYTVLSGSMEPTYHTGSVIYVKPCEPEEVQVGDPITFVLNEELVVATHRVIDIDAEEGAFYTKGDANAAADGSPVLFENLIGKPVFSIPYLGYVAAYVQEPPGTYVAVAACAVLIMLTFLPDLFAKEEDEEEEGKGKKQKKGKADEGAEPKSPLQPTYAAVPGMRAAEASARQRQVRAVPGVRQPAQQREIIRQENAASVRQHQAVAQAQPQCQVSSRQRTTGAAQSNNPRLRQQAYQQQRASLQVASATQAQARDLESYPPDGAQQGARPRR